MHHQDGENRRMSQLAPLNTETVIRESDNQALDPRHGFAAVANRRESDLHIGQQQMEGPAALGPPAPWRS